MQLWNDKRYEESLCLMRKQDSNINHNIKRNVFSIKNIKRNQNNWETSIGYI